MYQYHLVSVWKVKTYQENAWKAICDREKWILWWPGIKKITLVNDGTGKTYNHIQKGILLSYFNYNVQLTASEEPGLMEATASGELQGRLKWEIKQDGDTTTVIHTADLNIAKPWINKWEHFLKPLFWRNYADFMQKGAKALSKRLRIKFIGCENTIHTEAVMPIHLPDKIVLH